jgi:hypothetical protein
MMRRRRCLLWGLLMGWRRRRRTMLLVWRNSDHNALQNCFWQILQIRNGCLCARLQIAELVFCPKESRKRIRIASGETVVPIQKYGRDDDLTLLIYYSKCFHATPDKIQHRKQFVCGVSRGTLPSSSFWTTKIFNSSTNIKKRRIFTELNIL